MFDKPCHTSGITVPEPDKINKSFLLIAQQKK